MQIIQDINKMSECALALGNFDGLHRAHTRIIKNCAEYASMKNIPGGVLLFKNHTQTILNKDKQKILSDFDEKIELLEESGVDFVFVQNFDDVFMKLSGEEFFSYLVDKLKVRAIFVGFNYRFGYKAGWAAEDLKKMGQKQNIDVIVSAEMSADGVPISSTLIREYIKSGNMKKATELLGRLYSISGEVVSGKQNGRKMGLPTANVGVKDDKLLPPDGVYSGFTTISGIKHRSLINVGKNPTFGENERTVESFVLDFDEEIYNQRIKVEFEEKIREERKFSSPYELKKQISRDINKVMGKTIG